MSLLCASFQLNWFFSAHSNHIRLVCCSFSECFPCRRHGIQNWNWMRKKNRMGTNYFRFRLAKCDITASFHRPIHSFELKNMNQTWYSIFFLLNKKYFPKYYIPHFVQRKFTGCACYVRNSRFAPSHFDVICIRLQSHEVRNIYYLSTAREVLFSIYKTIGNGTKAIWFGVYCVSEKISNNIRHMTHTHAYSLQTVSVGWKHNAFTTKYHVFAHIFVIVIVVVSFERQEQIGKSLSKSQFYAENGKYRFVEIVCESCTCVQTS